VSIELPHRRGYHYAAGEILSPDGLCRAFDEQAAGTVFGSGVGVVVLRRLEEALRDGDQIYAVIRGSAVNNDGSQKAGYLAPSVEGQARAAAEALAMAGVEPASIQYIEAHGTGTPVGDPIELAALAQAYAGAGAGSCGVGSLKTHIGHLDTAAGVAALIKVCLALRHQSIPPSLNFSRPNSRLQIEKTPFHVLAQAQPWPRSTKPRRAAVNALGVGGTNAHVILEEPPAWAERRQRPAQDWQLLTLSARSATALQGLKAKWQTWLAQPDENFPADLSLADAAFTLQTGRREFEHRLAVVARDRAGLLEALQARATPRLVSGQAGKSAPPVVLMFPGGGAHYPGAGRDLLGQPAFREAVEACFAQMPADAPADLRQVMFGTPDDAAAALLQRPRYAIVALFTLEYAIARLWLSWGVRPAAVIGHSAGDYAAACLAGVMSLQDALSVVVLRGQLFEAVPPGGMMAVDLPEAQLREQMQGLELDLAAVNAPDACIASGALPALQALQDRLAAQGLDARRLHIEVAAHSRLLDGVLQTFRERMQRVRLRPPTMAFISNLDGQWATPDTLTDPEYWVRHLRHTVRFADGMQALLKLPEAVLIEAGPGQGLCALARYQTAGAGRGIWPSTAKAHEVHADLPVMLSAAGALWTRGLALDWPAVRGSGPVRRVSLPSYAFEHQRHWVEPGAVQAIRADQAGQADQAMASLPSQAAGQATEPSPASLPPRLAAAFTRLPERADWLQQPHWVPAALGPQALTPACQWLVFGSHSKLTADVVLRILNQGGRVTLVRPGEGFSSLIDGSFTVDPGEAGHFQQLLSSLEQNHALPDCVLHLWALEAGAAEPSPQLSAGLAGLRGQSLSFDSLLHLARAMQSLDLTGAVRLTVLTAGSQALPGELAVRPVQALALGPCRVVPHELPNVSARLMDVRPADLKSKALPRLIVAECLSTEAADLVVYRRLDRFVMQLHKAGSPELAPIQPQPPAQPVPALRAGGVYLITGGLGAIALELADYLARSQHARLALLSRRALPPRADWQRVIDSAVTIDKAGDADQIRLLRLLRQLLALEAAGAEVLTLSADVQDAAAMAQAVAECRARFGALHGVFHAAGVLEDGALHAKTPDSIGRVLGAKAQGAQVLHDVLPPGTLDFWAVFSSTSVYLGGPGQIDYVAGNAFADALAASRADGLSIHWGIWGDRGMAQRAYGPALAPSVAALAPPALLADTASVHPLLGTARLGDGGARFEAVYAPASLWVLDEHRVAGQPVLVGTAYIEIARAAMQQLYPGRGLEMRALSFGEAMVFESGAPREVLIELLDDKSAAGQEPSYEFSVRSRARPGALWQEHARAGVRVFDETLPVASPLPPIEQRPGQWLAGRIPQESAVAFGPRWRNLERVQLAGQAGTAELALPAEFAPDLQDYLCHPALTDMAATFGLQLLGQEALRDRLFVPLSVERVRLVGPVPRELVSRVELGSAASAQLVSFDVSLHTSDGAAVASFEGFCLRGLTPGAIKPAAPADSARASSTPGDAREPTLVESMLAGGIRGEDAADLFERIFSAGARDLMVSSIPLAELQRALQPVKPSPRKAAARALPAGDARLNPVERAIAGVWRELLGVDSIEQEDDFFALGGHSLAAVRLFARIRKEFGVDLPLATLFKTPTLAGLADLVVQERSRAAARAAGGAQTEAAAPAVSSRVFTPSVQASAAQCSREEAALRPHLSDDAGRDDAAENAQDDPEDLQEGERWSPLVQIKRGQAGRKPVFCVHGAAGNVLNFKLMADQLGADQPFYALQAQGVDGRLPPQPSIEAMAAQYVAAIRTVDAIGPYCLAGYSGGGVIAFEMAQQLKAAGAEVGLLVMLDTLSPAAALARISPLKKLWLMRRWSLDFALQWRERRRVSQAEKLNHALAMQSLAAGQTLSPELASAHLFTHFVATQERYRPQPYEGSLLLFRAEQGYTPYLNAGPALGWQAHVRGDIQVVEIPGSHVSMLSDPGLTQLAQAWRKELGRLSQSAEPRKDGALAGLPGLGLPQLMPGVFGGALRQDLP
jgi:acyl transferase domain-containing protein/thioesterase domain-containing protein